MVTSNGRPRAGRPRDSLRGCQSIFLQRAPIESRKFFFSMGRLNRRGLRIPFSGIEPGVLRQEYPSHCALTQRANKTVFREKRQGGHGGRTEISIN